MSIPFKEIIVIGMLRGLSCTHLLTFEMEEHVCRGRVLVRKLGQAMFCCMVVGPLRMPISSKCHTGKPASR